MKNPSFLIILIPLFLSTAAGDIYNDCVYTLYVKTGSIGKGGTDSKISIALGDAAGRTVWIPDLESWGLMGPHYNYYERGNIDIFSGRGPCIGTPVCRLNLSSDGSGTHHSWFCSYMEITSTGPHIPCDQSVFYVEQWLSRDVPPFELTTMIDGCKMRRGPADQRIKGGSFAVRKPRKRSDA